MAQASQAPPIGFGHTRRGALTPTNPHTLCLCLSLFVADCHHTCVTSPHPHCCLPKYELLRDPPS